MLFGACGGIVGAFMLLRKKSLVSDVASHAALPGIGLAYLLLEGNKGKHVPAGPYLVILPFIVYFAFAQLVLFIPDLIVNFSGYPRASEIVRVSQVEESSAICGSWCCIGTSWWRYAAG